METIYLANRVTLAQTQMNRHGGCFAWHQPGCDHSGHAAATPDQLPSYMFRCLTSKLLSDTNGCGGCWVCFAQNLRGSQAYIACVFALLSQ
eukprot:6394501-Amphidinium_carterae.1